MSSTLLGSTLTFGLPAPEQHCSDHESKRDL